MKKIYAVTVLLLTASVFSFAQDKEQVIALLYDVDERRTKYESEIISIEEFNFGIPWGTNWLVEWKNKEKYISTSIYVVDIGAGEIKFSAGAGPGSWRENDNFPFLFSSYYENFIGVTRGNGKYQIGDFNGDGFDDIAYFFAGASSPTFYINGNDPQDGKEKTYCSIPWLPVDDEYQISPVEFIMYKGMQGFQIYYPFSNNRGGHWVFYAWDGEQRKYVQKEVVEQKYIGVDAEPVQKQDEPPPEEELPEEAVAVALENERTDEGNAKDGKFIIIIALIIGGTAAVGVVIILLAARKRKKK